MTAATKPKVALSRESIFAVSDLTTEWIDVPEWGGGLYVRGLTAAERDRLETSLLNAKGEPQTAKLENYRARMIVACAVNEDGTPVFKGNADAIALGNKSASAINRVVDVARRLSGMTDEDVEELTKNSETVPSGDSPSD